MGNSISMVLKIKKKIAREACLQTPPEIRDFGTSFTTPSYAYLNGKAALMAPDLLHDVYLQKLTYCECEVPINFRSCDLLLL